VARLLRDFSWLIVGYSLNGRRSCWIDVRVRISSRGYNAARCISSRWRRSTRSGAAVRATYRRRRPTARSRSRRRSITSSSRIRRSLFWNWRPGRTAAAHWPTSSWSIGDCPGIGCSVRTCNFYEKLKSRSEEVRIPIILRGEKRDVDRAELIWKSISRKFREKCWFIFLVMRTVLMLSIAISFSSTTLQYNVDYLKLIWKYWHLENISKILVIALTAYQLSIIVCRYLIRFYR